jgi:O-antigen biosynthesis protein
MRIPPPIVDIILPFHGQYHALQKCINSIARHSLGIFYTITIVDDCSPNNFILEGTKRTNIQAIRLPEHKGFGAALKAGFDATHNKLVCFINSDCEITKLKWLEDMIISLDSMKKEGVKLVSARMNDAGTGDSDPAVVTDENPTKDRIAEQTLPLVCCLMNRKLFDNIGGFIKEYPYGWYEDEELFWRMKKHGYKQGICGNTWIHHEGGLTVKNLIKKPQIREKMENNRELCLQDLRGKSP